MSRFAGVAGNGRSFIEYMLLGTAVDDGTDCNDLPTPLAVVRRPKLSYTGSANSTDIVDVGDVGRKSVNIEVNDGVQLGVRGFRGMVT